MANVLHAKTFSDAPWLLSDGIISTNLGDLQDGGRVKRGDHLPPHKYIRNTSTCGKTLQNTY